MWGGEKDHKHELVKGSAWLLVSRDVWCLLTHSCILKIQCNVRRNLGKQSSPKCIPTLKFQPWYKVIVVEEVSEATVLKTWARDKAPLPFLPQFTNTGSPVRSVTFEQISPFFHFKNWRHKYTRCSKIKRSFFFSFSNNESWRKISLCRDAPKYIKSHRRKNN